MTRFLVRASILSLISCAVLVIPLSPSAVGEECYSKYEMCQRFEEKEPGKKESRDSVAAPSEELKYVSYACNTGATGVGSCETEKECPEGTTPYVVVLMAADGADPRAGAMARDIRCWGDDAQSIAEVVTAEFAKTRPEVPFPTIQDGGIMLVNWPIVFSSTVTQYDAQTSALGRAVTMRVIPMEYVWNFGDGNKKTTKTPGKPIDVSDATNYDQGYRAYVDKYASIYHLYEKCGFINPSLSVTFRGQYSLDGVTFHNIPGTVTTDSPVQQFRLYEARAELVDPNRPMPSPKSTSCVAGDKD